MSDVSLNINLSAETAQTRAPNNQSRKRKRFQKKRHQLENNDSMEGKRKRKHRKRKKGQSSASEEGSVFAAPFPKLVCPSSTGNRYECLASTQNNNCLPSSSSTGSSSKPSTSTQNSISSAPPSSTASAPECSFKPSGQNRNSSPSSSTASSFKPSTQDKGLPQPSRAAGASNCSSTSSASHSLPSSNTRAPYDSQELWSTALAAAAAAPASSATSSHKQASKTAAGIPTKYLAIDCEMVGTGPKGSISQLARCSVVNYEGDVVYDKFINPAVPVTDYRTRWSGIRRCDLINATPYAVARKEILKLLMGKVVIGHAVHNDFKVLSYCHPAAMTRDTARIPLLNQRAGIEGNQSASLKRLTKAILNRDIQTGRKGHSSVEDAKATMELYKVVEEEWERTLASRASSGPV